MKVRGWAAALAVGVVGLTVVPGPMAPARPVDAAPAGSLSYTCQVLGQTRTFRLDTVTDVPGRLAFGQAVTATVWAALVVPEDVTAAFRDDLRAATTNGPATVGARIGKTATPWSLTFPTTPLPPTGSLVLSAAAPLGVFAGERIGRTWRVRANGDLSTTLSFYRADGQPTSPIPSATITCALADGQRDLVQRIEVVKDQTTTTVVGKDTAEGTPGRAKVKVASTYGRRVRGEVKVKLFHRGELVSTRLLALEKGKVRLRTRRLSERGWSMTAKYAGSKRFRGSHGADKIKVR